VRPNPAPIWQAWNAGGPFVGDSAPHSRVTVDKNWSLNLQQQAGRYPKVPVRWFQRLDNTQVETEVPNIKNISIDKSLDTDAASCTISLYNTKMHINTATAGEVELGQPGFYTWRYRSDEANARWGPRQGQDWLKVLTPDALLRTYQGYGGLGLSIPAAVAAGNLVITGTWLVDSVRVRHDGTLELACRDMAKLLIEQHCYIPLVPAAYYPHGLRYCRYYYVDHAKVDAVPGVNAITAGNKRCVYENVGASAASASDVYYGFNGKVHGHRASDAFDGDDSTYWLSVGNDSPEEPFAVEWIEAASGDDIDRVIVTPYIGGYRCYVSVMEGGAWVDQGLGSVQYNPAGIGRYTGVNTAVIPFVAQAGVQGEGPTEIVLPRRFKADKVRFTFTNLQQMQWGPYYYRAGVRQLGLSLGAGKEGTGGTPGVPAYTSQEDGNYRDYSDIIKDLALWSGFMAYNPASPSAEAAVYGNVELTGIADTGGCVGEDVFDKKPVIDAMHTIRDIVGYIIYVDEEGAFHFETPNWFKSGNFNLAGRYMNFVPGIDEKVQLTDYAVEYSDKNLRSQIIVSSDEPTAGFSDTVTTRFTPPDGQANVLRGIVKPMMLINKLLVDPGEQLDMAALIAVHIAAATYVGNLSCAANPCIGMNDQVIIHERVTGETGIHYIRGVRMTHDLDSGSFEMNLTTFRVGDEKGFILTVPSVGGKTAAAPYTGATTTRITHRVSTGTYGVVSGGYYPLFHDRDDGLYYFSMTGTTNPAGGYQGQQYNINQNPVPPTPHEQLLEHATHPPTSGDRPTADVGTF